MPFNNLLHELFFLPRSESVAYVRWLPTQYLPPSPRQHLDARGETDSHHCSSSSLTLSAAFGPETTVSSAHMGQVTGAGTSQDPSLTLGEKSTLSAPASMREKAGSLVCWNHIAIPKRSQSGNESDLQNEGKELKKKSQRN